MCEHFQNTELGIYIVFSLSPADLYFFFGFLEFQYHYCRGPEVLA